MPPQAPSVSDVDNLLVQGLKNILPTLKDSVFRHFKDSAIRLIKDADQVSPSARFTGTHSVTLAP